jgi:acetoin utilization deacetylase AcuC-like enzyme
MVKYRLLRERCLREGVLAPQALHEAPPARWEELSLAHDLSYLAEVREGRLDALQQRRIGFPWSRAMVERSRRSAGATLAAARHALGSARRLGWGVGINLAGGTHHAGIAHGEGFCVFNDAAVAVRVLMAERAIERAVILDCDVHQGNGTAEIFRADPGVSTFSIHGAKNFPFRKERSTVDVELPDGSGDDLFLAALDLHVPQLLDSLRPGLAIFLAGADPLRGDRYGRLAMTPEGLLARDGFVLSHLRRRGIPVAIAMAGGYAPDPEDTVSVHLGTIRTAVRLWSELTDGNAVPHELCEDRIQ